MPPLTAPLHRRHWMAIAAGLSLSGCQAPPPVLRLGAIPFAGYSFLFLAQALGLTDPRLVRMKELRSNTDVMRALATSRLDAAALTLDEVLSGVQGGLALQVVAVLDQSAGADAVMARPPLREARDLRGRRIAVESSAVGALMLAALLDAAGLRAADVEQVRTALPDSAEAYRQGRADAVVTAEPWASQLEAEGAIRLFDSRAIPGRIVDVLVVRHEVLATHAQQVEAAVNGHFAALHRFQTQPATVSATLAQRLQLPPAEVASAFQGLDLPSRQANQQLLARGGVVAQGLPALVALLQAQGLLERRALDTTDLLDPRWVQGAG